MQQARDFIGAERCYQTVLRDHPDHPDALNLLGTIAIEAKRLDAAVALFLKALAASPGHPGYLSNLGSVHIRLRRHPEAARAFEDALRAQPRLVDAMIGLSHAYRAMNRADEALAMAEQAHELAPANSKATLALAGVLVGLGDNDRAVGLLRSAIARRDSQMPAALIALATAHKFAGGEPEPALMQQLASDARAPDESRAGMLHALGKARADLKEFDAAFAAYNEAKSLLGRSFDAAQTAQYYDTMIDGLTADFFAERRDFGHPDAEPVFIVGMPRSGTTLTEQICSSHSQVVGVGEVPSMNLLANRLGWRRSKPAELLAALSRLTAAQSRELAQTYLDEVASYGGVGGRVTDKTPHNYEFLGLIALLFPRARIIHCVRDPLDNCLSCFTHNFSESHGYNADLSVLGTYYRSYERLMAHWKTALPLPILDNSYEQLVDAQEAQSRRLIDFLGLEWEDACLDFQSNDRLVLTPSRWQVRQPIYRSSLQQWRRYAAHLDPLIAALGIVDPR